MIKFYTNRDLSQRFDINFAKWKRWSREFLPPDFLGGLQSGYARQYNQNEAFTVYLGGLLVADLKFSIPDAKKILEELHDWLTASVLCTDFDTPKKDVKGTKGQGEQYQILIQAVNNRTASTVKFFTAIRCILADESITIHGNPARRFQYLETVLNNTETKPCDDDMLSARVLNISRVFARFKKTLNSEVLNIVSD